MAFTGARYEVSRAGIDSSDLGTSCACRLHVLYDVVCDNNEVTGYWFIIREACIACDLRRKKNTISNELE